MLNKHTRFKTQSQTESKKIILEQQILLRWNAISVIAIVSKQYRASYDVGAGTLTPSLHLRAQSTAQIFHRTTISPLLMHS